LAIAWFRSALVTALWVAGVGAAPSAQGPSTQAGAPTIFEVALSARSFNPSRGETLGLTYRLSSAATVTVRVFDPDLQLVRVVVDQARQTAGAQKVTWNGHDLDGRIVPNEAYLFTIEARGQTGTMGVYDPMTFSGGEPFDLGAAQVSRETGTLSYRLSQPSRVLVRIGIPGSALLRTLVDWEPRVQGEITEYWNGRDQDNVINVIDNPNYTVLITYFTLPDATVVTFGNTAIDYRAYKAQRRAPRPAKEARPMANARRLSPQFLAARARNRDFRVSITFPALDKGDAAAVPTVRDRVLARIDVPERDREVVAGRQYEIILFVDTTYFAEEERGYVPFNFPWELRQLPPGEHTLTVNVVTFDGQIGIGSRRIRIAR
jgi:hypothetical protein